MKPEIKIERWFIIGDRMYGEIDFHPKLGNCNDGIIRTSKVVKVETQNSVYILGKPATGNERTMALKYGEDEPTKPAQEETE